MAVSLQLGKGSRNVFGRGAKARAVVRAHQVIVNGLGSAHDGNSLNAFLSNVSGQLVHSIHGIISADIEEISDAVVGKSAEQLGVDRIIQILRQLVPAGAEIGSRSCPDQLEFAGALQRLHIHELII